MVKFAIYTFLGFILESVYVSILKKEFYLSGLLKGPFIPIYGFGALFDLSIVLIILIILKSFFIHYSAVLP